MYGDGEEEQMKKSKRVREEDTHEDEQQQMINISNVWRVVCLLVLLRVLAVFGSVSFNCALIFSKEFHVLFQSYGAENSLGGLRPLKNTANVLLLQQ